MLRLSGALSSGTPFSALKCLRHQAGCLAARFSSTSAPLFIADSDNNNNISIVDKSNNGNHNIINRSTAEAPSLAEQPKPQKVSSIGYRRLFSLAVPESKLLGLGSLALMISTGVSMTIPFGFGSIVDIAAASMSCTPDASAMSLSTLTFVLGGLFGIGAIASSARVYLFSVAGARVVARLQREVYQKILSQPVHYFDSRRSGDFVTCLASDVKVVSSAITGDTLAAGCRNLLQIIGSVGIMIYMSPALTSVMFGVAPAIGLSGFLYGRYVKTVSKQVQQALGDASAAAEERISDIRTVKAFVREAWESQRFELQVANVFNWSRKAAKAHALFSGGTNLIGNASMLAVLGYGSHLVVSDVISPGTLTSFMLYSMYLGVGIMCAGSLHTFRRFVRSSCVHCRRGTSKSYGEVMTGLGAGERVFGILDQASERRSGQKLRAGNGHIVFDKVCFRYPSRSDVPILDDFSLNVAPGSITALVGQSGSGKSTIASLLLKFYSIDSGSIYIDEHDLAEVDPQWVRRHIGIVSQEPTLFSGTVLDNILYGREGASIEEAKHCAKLANAHEFIESFPDGYHTVIGQKGTTVSGGQKQRIAIARALLKDPELLILDEATSALDAQSEQMVQEALARLMKNRTTLLIAHSQAAMRQADTIAVINEGRIVEHDTHQQLMEQSDSLYRKLVKLHRQS